MMQDNKEKPIRRHEIFILGLLVGVSTATSIILYYGDGTMPKIMLSIAPIALLTVSLMYIRNDDKLDRK